MVSTCVVERVDVFCDGPFRDISGLETDASDEFSLQGFKEVLRWVVIAAISLGRHRDVSSGALEYHVILRGAILAAPG